MRIDSDERKVVDSVAYQRLRHIHQPAMTYLVYPGATHRRFEHCLGVMEVATRVFDVVTDTRNVTNDVARELINEEESRLSYWRSALRMAALCHDLGHLPFSHAAEDLLPPGTNHESISLELIRSDQMREHWNRMKLVPEDIAKLAVGQKKHGAPLTPWESILSEIIVGDGFGADRIDYLLRDSHHA
ncbi:MAG: HD domain-containing protein, partial [Bryobacteraceae bacterium]